MTNKQQKLKESNNRSAAEAHERVKGAYGHWLSHGSTVQACKVWKTDRMKLNKYINEQGHNRKSCDINTFNLIDTEEKAYWLGFLYADGSVATKSNHVELSLQLGDIDHLRKYKKFINATTNIGHDHFRCRITTCIGEYKQSLIKWGCVPKKSLIVTYPSIPEELDKHFVRGVFDGDGCIWRTCKDCLWNSAGICSGSKVFLDVIMDIIERGCGVRGNGPYRTSKGSPVHNIFYQGTTFRRLVDWMYFDAKIYLDRKYKRYTESTAIVLGDEQDRRWIKDKLPITEEKTTK